MKDKKKGWISIHRNIREHWLWEDSSPFSRLKAWLDLLLHAAHTDDKVLIRAQVFHVKRGEQVRSIRTLAKTWKWSINKVRRYLELLKEDEMITYANEGVTTRINILNYDTYQQARDANDTAGHERDSVNGKCSEDESNLNENRDAKESDKQFIYNNLEVFAEHKRNTNGTQTEHKRNTSESQTIIKQLNNSTKDTLIERPTSEPASGSANGYAAAGSQKGKAIVQEKYWATAEQLSHRLLHRILEWQPDHKYSRNRPAMKRWTQEIERAMRLDGRSPEQLGNMIDFLFREDHETAIFWRKNVQSGEKLRHQFQQVKDDYITKRELDARKGRKGRPASRNTAADVADFLEEARKMEEEV